MGVEGGGDLVALSITGGVAAFVLFEPSVEEGGETMDLVTL